MSFIGGADQIARMENDEANLAESDKPRRKNQTYAGRLLAVVTGSGSVELGELARRLNVPVHRLRDCRDGSDLLPPEVQLVLAALVVEMSPPHASLAHRLYAQAQSAMRTQKGAVESHLTYPVWQRRLDRD
jgi:hypothetical protein